MTELDFSQITGFVQDVGIWVLFAWLYVQEKKAHEASRQRYDIQLQELRMRHTDDLREIAGLRQNLNRVQTYVRDAQTVPSNSEMQPM